MTLAELLIKLKVDQTGLVTGLNQAQQSAKKAENSFDGLKKKIAAALTVAGLVKFTESILRAASDAEEQGQKFRVVFSNMGQNAKKMSDELAASYGLSRTESQAFLAANGNLFTSLGFTQEKAFELASDITKLGVDLASFNNTAGGAKAVVDSLSKALIGERESLKINAQISVLDEDLKQFAVTQGKVWEATTKQERAFLTLQYITKLSKNAIGDFNRSQFSFANQSRIARSNIENLRESLGSSLLPVASLGLRIFNEFAKELDKGAQQFKNFTRSAEGADKIGDFLGGLVGLVTTVKTSLEPSFEAIKELFAKVKDAIVETIIPLVSAEGSTSSLAVAAQVLALGFKLVGDILGVSIRLLGNFISTTFEAAKIFTEFSKILVGQGSFAKVSLQFDKFTNSANKLNEDLAKGLVNVSLTFKNGVATISGDSEKLTKKLQDQYNLSAASAKKMVMDALLAQEEYKKTLQTVSKESTRQELERAVATAQDADKNRTLRLQLYKLAVDQLGFSFSDLKKRSEFASKMWNDLLPEEKLQTFNTAAQSIGNSILGVMQSMTQLFSALAQQAIAALEQEKQAALEAAGVAEETAVQKAEREYTEAVAGGDALVIAEKQKALKRAKIEEEFQKKKKKLEFEAAHTAWEMQMAMAITQGLLAPLNAFVGTLAWASKIPGGYAIAAGLAALAAIAAGISVAAVAASEPKPPKFAAGGIVPGSLYNGDNVMARVNSGEMILNQQQQSNLFNALDTGATASNPAQGGGMAGNVYLDGNYVGQWLNTALDNGLIQVPTRVLKT